MPGFLDRYQGGAAVSGASGMTRLDEIRTRRSLSALEATTTQRLANVVADGAVAEQKCRSLDHAGRTAALGQVALSQFADVACGGDPLARDEARFLMDIIKLGKAEVLTDLALNDYCNERRFRR
jgi:hypothetical protein